MDWCLNRNEDSTFTANCFFVPADLRLIASSISYATPAYRTWLVRVDLGNDDLIDTLDAVEYTNSELYLRFDELFDG